MNKEEKRAYSAHGVDNYHRKRSPWGKFENIFLVSHSWRNPSRVPALPSSRRNQLRQGRSLCGRHEPGGRGLSTLLASSKMGRSKGEARRGSGLKFAKKIPHFTASTPFQIRHSCTITDCAIFLSSFFPPFLPFSPSLPSPSFPIRLLPSFFLLFLFFLPLSSPHSPLLP